MTDGLLSLSGFDVIGEPELIRSWHPSLPKERQYILRMCVKTPGSSYKLPKELGWVAPLLDETDSYVYVTVRHGLVTSETDDEWHVDGFSMRKPHPPEFSYIWSNLMPTEFLRQHIKIPSDFSPLKHNLHYLIQDQAREECAWAGSSNVIYRITPYVVHRRPRISSVQRSFSRVSYVPIEIEDSRNTLNPLLQIQTGETKDFRETLSRYPLTMAPHA